MISDADWDGEMRFGRLAIVVFTLMLLSQLNPYATGAADPKPRSRPPSKAKEATLTGYFDGDKLYARVDNKEETVHLIGVDAPETTKWECAAFAGLDRIRDLIPTDATVYVETGKVERDKGDRLYAWVWYGTEAGFFLLNDTLIREGLAIYEKPDKGNDRYADQLESAQNTAKKAKVAIWKDCGGNGHKKALPCQDVDQSVVDALSTVLDPSAGVWLRGAKAVREPSRVHMYLIAADIEGPGMDGDNEIGVWAITGEIGPGGNLGAVQATKGFAGEFSVGIPTLGYTDTAELEGWDDAQKCVKDAL